MKIWTPYAGLPIDQLEETAKNCWMDGDHLRKIVLALLNRKNTSALRLRWRLIKRLIDIEEIGGPWPSTKADGGNGTLHMIADWPDIGVLGFMGYKVGENGLGVVERQEILDYAYNREVPPFESDEYMVEWGTPQTWKRLYKIANCLAAFTRNAKRRTRNKLKLAIEQWESDLEYLRVNYYERQYSFEDWPEIQSFPIDGE